MTAKLATADDRVLASVDNAGCHLRLGQEFE